MTENEKNINSPNEEDENKEAVIVPDETAVAEDAVSADEDSARNDEETAEEITDAEEPETPEVVYAYKWTYSDQFANDKKIDNAKDDVSKTRKGARNYALIMICAFALAFAVLAFSLSLDNIASLFRDDSSRELSVVEITEKGLPSCVSIFALKGENSGSSGSGFVVNSFGYVVTNYHVIKNALNVVAVDSENKQYSATVVGYDEEIDLALLYLEGCELSAAALADSDSSKLGETVVAIGIPAGSGSLLSVSDGIISGFERVTGSSSVGMIQTNAPLNPGNSGGPLFDSHGNVVGVVTSKLSYGMDAEGEKIPLDGIAYAIPSNAIKEYINAWMDEDLKSPMLGITAVSVESGNSYFYDGSDGIIYGYENASGVEYKVLSSGLREELTIEDLNAPENIIIHAKATGLYVIGVTKGLGAYGKIEKGDIVTEIGGIKTKNVTDARAVFEEYSAGDTISVELNRDGQTIRENMTLKTKKDMLSAERG